MDDRLFWLAVGVALIVVLFRGLLRVRDTEPRGGDLFCADGETGGGPVLDPPDLSGALGEMNLKRRDVLAIAKKATVAVVVDCCFGDRLPDLAHSGMPLWVMDTSDNRISVEELRPVAAARGASITTFKSASESPEEAFIAILPVVDMHHNRLASNPPYAAVEVFGASATSAVKKALHDFAFTVVAESATHFRAEASPAQE